MIRPLFTAAAIIALPALAGAAPLYPNSVASNALDFITDADKSAYSCFGYNGEITAEMPDQRANRPLMANGVFSYTARYTDGTSVDFWVHHDIGSEDNARKYVEMAAPRVGKLPTFMRAKLNHVVIHKGNQPAFAEDRGRFLVLYSQNMKKRARNKDLEETIFHESVHATLDHPLAKSKAYRKAQRSDGDFVTNYARDNSGEDMAESALFAWAITQHPGRLPAKVEAKVKQIMPARLAYFDKLFSAKPLFYKVGPKKGC